jgi:hypothetical protein
VIPAGWYYRIGLRVGVIGCSVAIFGGMVMRAIVGVCINGAESSAGQGEREWSTAIGWGGRGLGEVRYGMVLEEHLSGWTVAIHSKHNSTRD